jgi:hypothetical protein
MPNGKYRGRQLFLKQLPDRVIETTNLRPNFQSLVELKDGSLLANNGQVSTDESKSWSEPHSFGEGIEGVGLIRLQSGKLALTGNRIHFSEDEGKTWGRSADVLQKTMAKVLQANSLADTTFQLSSGRLLYTPYLGFKGTHPKLRYEDVSSYGSWQGQRYQIEGHGHFPEMGLTLVLYSDDEGQSWHHSEGQWSNKNCLMGWFDSTGNANGAANVIAFEEVSAAETNDGRVLLFGRSTVGRILYSVGCDNGETFSAVLPTELANSNSPARLRRIPQTGDLICIWNQVSREEIQRGQRRGRLSTAISGDNGTSWEHFKTIELSEGLEDIHRIHPEDTIKVVRARDDVGELPEHWAYFHYANICFFADKVCLIYSRGGPKLGIAEQNLKKQEQVLRVYPLDWFYA